MQLPTVPVAYFWGISSVGKASLKSEDAALVVGGARCMCVSQVKSQHDLRTTGTVVIQDDIWGAYVRVRAGSFDRPTIPLLA